MTSVRVTTGADACRAVAVVVMTPAAAMAVPRNSRRAIVHRVEAVVMGIDMGAFLLRRRPLPRQRVAVRHAQIGLHKGDRQLLVIGLEHGEAIRAFGEERSWARLYWPQLTSAARDEE